MESAQTMQRNLPSPAKNGISGDAPAAIMHTAMPRRFDPVRDLPGDMAAICLSFVGAESLLGSAQLVNRAWRDAIDGGLPAVWGEVCLKHELTKAQLVTLVRAGRWCLWKLQLFDRATNVANDLSLPNLRVLHITPPNGFHVPRSFLSSFSLLEDLSVKQKIISWSVVELPPLQHLTSVNCDHCSVQGVPNLPALTKLKTYGSYFLEDFKDAWPANLRELTIYRHPYVPHILNRIAALQQLVLLATDWSFALPKDRCDSTPPYDKFAAILAQFTTLQRFKLKIIWSCYPLEDVLLNNHCLGALSHLRHLSLDCSHALDKHLECLQQLTNLQRVKLHDVRRITAQGLRYVCTLPNLSSLCIANDLFGSNRIDYSLIGTSSQLRELNLDCEGAHVSPAQIQALTQLQYLEKLTIKACFDDPVDIVRRICAIRSLHELALLEKCFNVNHTSFPVSAFSALPQLTSLEKLCVTHPSFRTGYPHTIGEIPALVSVSELVDYLVQIPTLRYVFFVGVMFDEHNQTRLRSALPRLETIAGNLSV